jgi:phage-related minor tail protein
MGKKAAGKYYQAGVDSATSFLKGIQDTVNEVNLILDNPNLTMTDIINAGLIESGFNIPDISGFDMSGILSGINFGMGTLMADGGVVTRGTSIIAGEAGPEAIIPLDRLGSMGMGGGMNITVNAGLVSTPDQVGQEIIQAILKSQRRSGAVFAPATGISY